MTFPDNNVDTSQGQVETPGQENQGGTGGNPWDSYLTDLPESVRPLVEPKFKEWDANVTQRFQKVHSEYEPLKGFSELIENGWELDDVRQAVNLAHQINTNPRAVYDALANAYNFAMENQALNEQGQQGNQPEEFGDEFGELPPAIRRELQELREQVEANNSVLTAQQEAENARQAEAQVNQIFSALHNAYGEFDDSYVAFLMYNGVDPNQAVAQAQSLTPQQQQEQQQQAPVVMGSGGGVPSSAVTPSQLSDKERKALVAELVKNAAQSGD